MRVNETLYTMLIQKKLMKKISFFVFIFTPENLLAVSAGFNPLP